jgi:polysaccharide deacetylase 2 family uncharacterized protein YibQ
VRRFPFLAVVIAAALIAAVVLILERVERRPDEPATRRAPGKETSGKKAAAKTPRPTASKSVHPGRQIAIVIDDIGFDLKIVEELAGLPAPVAFAVLPHAPHAAEAARLLHAAGKEILLHLPMEPHAYPAESPGAGALMADMDEAEIRRQIREDLALVPFASGVNNHMGSRFMEDGFRLAIVMDELRRRGLFFVDSKTTADSRGMAAAGRAGVRFAARDLFIDHTPGYAAALETLTGPFRHERDNGAPVLMIGHPHPQTLRAIRDALPVWHADGVRVIPVSACLRISGGAEKQGSSAKQRAGAMNPHTKGKRLDDPDVYR